MKIFFKETKLLYDIILYIMVPSTVQQMGFLLFFTAVGTGAAFGQQFGPQANYPWFSKCWRFPEILLILLLSHSPDLFLSALISK